ncbi:hypothetical protein PM3016_2437 [Paenibacillus mucilaginosus 3016]|uniref:Uncharacterized protein n=2 Tax=Paenibacillus mucilaginosus TaxID=61624 RepID=H6NL19_9BACL|nr:hypothetical protein PM3016_2437 [Paenibacillus mucilaginosus 3016]
MFATFRRSDNGLLGTAVLVSEALTGPLRPHSEGPLVLTVHTPNRTPDERPVFLRIVESGGRLTVPDNLSV